jgi:hypothetical protein
MYSLTSKCFDLVNIRPSSHRRRCNQAYGAYPLPTRLCVRCYWTALRSLREGSCACYPDKVDLANALVNEYEGDLQLKMDSKASFDIRS